MRGYLHRRTGEIVIPEIYSHAWIFSEGLAAVEQNGNINFIDPSGKVVIDKDFPMYYDNKTDYVFTNGHCLMRNPANGKKGLIDKSGQWVLPAEYDELFFTRGFWQAEKDGRTGLYTADLKMLLPVEYQSIQVSDSIIEVHLADHSVRRYDHQGRVVVDFVIDEISSLRYEIPTPRNGSETCDNDTCATQNTTAQPTACNILFAATDITKRTATDSSTATDGASHRPATPPSRPSDSISTFAYRTE